MMEDLDVPNTLYALDKSVRSMILLDEVTFEIMDGTGDRQRTCRFGNGALEE